MMAMSGKMFRSCELSLELEDNFMGKKEKVQNGNMPG
jgi:hypothetical protein